MIQLAFYGRTTSPDWRASRAWQYARGKALIEPHGGVIVAEFFDIDKSRSIPPQRRNLWPPDRGDIATDPVIDLGAVRIRRRKVLGGLIHEYERAA